MEGIIKETVWGAIKQTERLEQHANSWRLCVKEVWGWNRAMQERVDRALGWNPFRWMFWLCEEVIILITSPFIALVMHRKAKRKIAKILRKEKE